CRPRRLVVGYALWRKPASCQFTKSRAVTRWSPCGMWRASRDGRGERVPAVRLPRRRGHRPCSAIGLWPGTGRVAEGRAAGRLAGHGPEDPRRVARGPAAAVCRTYGVVLRAGFTPSPGSHGPGKVTDGVDTEGRRVGRPAAAAAATGGRGLVGTL